jgi:hypothetical protein
VQTAVFAKKLNSTTLIPSSDFNSKITYTTQYIIFHAIVEGAVIGHVNLQVNSVTIELHKNLQGLNSCGMSKNTSMVYCN